MRGKKAKRLRCEAKARGEKKTRVRSLNCKAEPGPNHAMRRMMKFRPRQYEDLQLKNDPAAKRIQVRRWNWLYSKFRPLPKTRQNVDELEPWPRRKPPHRRENQT
jgi:hypothetical protein